MRRDPDSAAELVTQALLNASAIGDRATGAWTHVLLTDYEGWIRTDELAEPPVKGFTRIGQHCATPLDLAAVVTVVRTDLCTDITGNEVLDTAYLSTVLPLLDTTQPARLQVALPGGATAWIERSAIIICRLEQPYLPKPIEMVTDYARSFESVPYLWGGTSFAGIDCSGFIQLCYRMGGYILPRDANQQHDVLLQSITRQEMHAGDLIFFGSKAITHVAMALSNKAYIHAEGQNYHRVVISSLDPADPHYCRRLDEIVWAIKRVHC